MPSDQKVFRPSPWAAGGLVVGICISLAFAIFFLYNEEYGGRVWLAAGCLGIAILLPVGLVDFHVSKIVLGEDTIDLIGLLSQQSYHRDEIEFVEMSGREITLFLKPDGDVTIPGVFKKQRVLFNSIRAWLERSDDSEKPRSPEIK